MGDINNDNKINKNPSTIKYSENNEETTKRGPSENNYSDIPFTMEISVALNKKPAE